MFFNRGCGYRRLFCELLQWAFLLLAGLLPADAQGPGVWQVEDAPARHVTLTLFKSKTFRLDRVFTTAVVGSPEIADVFPLTDRSLYILGKKVGTTNVSVYDQNQKLAGVIDLEVAIDSRNLGAKNKFEHGNARHPCVIDEWSGGA